MAWTRRIEKTGGTLEVPARFPLFASCKSPRRLGNGNRLTAPHVLGEELHGAQTRIIAIGYLPAHPLVQMETAVTTSLADGYTMGRARPDLAPEIHALITVVEIDEFGEAGGYTLDEVNDELAGIDTERDTWIVSSPDGDIVGYAYLRDRRHVRLDVEVYVHPNHAGKGIGTKLVRASEERAREHIALAPPEAKVVLYNWINGQNQAAGELLRREGYEPYRFFLRMEMSLDSPIPTPEWPEGVRVRTCVAGQNEPIFYRTLEDAMEDHWGHIPLSYEEWIERRKRSTFDPTLWFLAEENGEPAGAAICSISEEIGWVDYLGVRAPWRRKGLGMALLLHAAREFRHRGLRKMALGVDSDSPTGATRLYERAGMRAAQQHATYGKELRSGWDLSGDSDSF